MIFTFCVLFYRTSSKKSRLEGYLAAGDLGNRFLVRFSRLLTSDIPPELTLADIAAIDAAGERGARHDAFFKTVRVMVGLMLLGATIFRVHAFVAKA